MLKRNSKAKRQYAKAAKGLADDWGSGEFERHGSLAGPPSRPEASEVGSTSLLLRWEEPTHLGGSAFEVLGYQVDVQCGGEGGFSVLIDDTAERQPQWIVEGLTPDTWHVSC